MASLRHPEAQIHGGRVSRPLALKAFGPVKRFQLPCVFSLAVAEFQGHHPRHVLSRD
jgi:hypothetical protein